MWLDLKKATFDTHNIKTHFSSSNDSCTLYLTIWYGTDVESCLAAFAQACFWGLSDIDECPGRLQMAPYLLCKQTICCNSPDGWLMSLDMDLATSCDMYVEVKMAPMDAVIKPGTFRPKARARLFSRNWFCQQSVCMCESVCLAPGLLITSDVMWYDKDLNWLV